MKRLINFIKKHKATFFFCISMILAIAGIIPLIVLSYADIEVAEDNVAVVGSIPYLFWVPAIVAFAISYEYMNQDIKKANKEFNCKIARDKERDWFRDN